LSFLLSSKSSPLPHVIESLQPTPENELDPSHLSQSQTAALPCPLTSQNHKVRVILWHHNSTKAAQEHFPSQRELSARQGESGRDSFSRRDLPSLNWTSAATSVQAGPTLLMLYWQSKLRITFETPVS